MNRKRAMHIIDRMDTSQHNAERYAFSWQIGESSNTFSCSCNINKQLDINISFFANDFRFNNRVFLALVFSVYCTIKRPKYGRDIIRLTSWCDYTAMRDVFARKQLLINQVRGRNRRLISEKKLL